MNTIAFDIDGTWTLDPSGFFDIATRLRDIHGWRVLIVTGSEQPDEKLYRLGIKAFGSVVLTVKGLKKQAVLDLGYHVDVWVDDMPGFIEPCRVLDDNLDKLEPKEININSLDSITGNAVSLTRILQSQMTGEQRRKLWAAIQVGYCEYCGNHDPCYCWRDE